MKKRKNIIIGLIVLVFIIIILVLTNRNDSEPYFQVTRGDITEELFESGTIERGNSIKLSFRESGVVESIYFEEGQQVKKNDIIASLDKADLRLFLTEAQAGYTSASASLQRFLSGATTQEISIVESTVKSAEINLSSAKDNLQKQQEIINESFNRTYQNVPTLLGDIFSTTKEIEIGVNRISRTYFVSIFVSETNSGRRSRDAITESFKVIEKYKELATQQQVSFSQKEIALEKTIVELKKILINLDNLINISDSDFYKDRFSEADSALLREYRRIINMSLNEANSLSSTISSIKAEKNAQLVNLENNIKLAENSLFQAQKELSRIKTSPDSSDIKIRRAAIDQAKARVQLSENRIENSLLRSPVDGILSIINIRQGESVMPANPVAVIAPQKNIQIAINIYEGDIPKVDIGNKAKVSFVAFPGKEFQGEVVSINPVGEVKDGIVYYKIIITLNDYPEKAMIGMTVDVNLITNEKKNVLMIPERAVIRENNRTYVNVLQDNEQVKKEIRLGLRGKDRMVEVISGLSENEKVLTN